MTNEATTEELATELAGEFFPLVQKWEADFHKSVLKWIDQAKKMGMPFPILVPLIELVVTKRVEQIREYSLEALERLKKEKEENV